MTQVRLFHRCVSLHRHLPAAARALCVLGLGLWITADCQAQWKWRDATGRIQYSDRPPPQDVPATAILQRPAGIEPSRNAPVVVIQPLNKPASMRGTAAPAASASAVPPAPRAAAADPQTEARRKEAQAREDAERRQQEAQLAQQRSQNCLRAQENLRTLESGMRIARVNEQGEREILGDAQRTQAIADAQRVVASDCQ